jgi:hypothetical protein
MLFHAVSDKKYNVRTKDGTEFDGWCWPGAGGLRCGAQPEHNITHITQHNFTVQTTP